MKRFLLLGAMLVMAGGLSSCKLVGVVKGSGKKATDSRTVGEFTKVELSSSADMTITVGSAQTVVVESDDNIVPLITTTVSGETLTVGSSKGYSTKLGVKVLITVPELEGVKIDGSGDIRISGLTGERFRAVISGSSTIKPCTSAS